MTFPIYIYIWKNNPNVPNHQPVDFFQQIQVANPSRRGKLNMNFHFCFVRLLVRFFFANRLAAIFLFSGVCWFSPLPAARTRFALHFLRAAKGRKEKHFKTGSKRNDQLIYPPKVLVIYLKTSNPCRISPRFFVRIHLWSVLGGTPQPQTNSG